jgi:hypothetical protein
MRRTAAHGQTALPFRQTPRPAARSELRAVDVDVDIDVGDPEFVAALETVLHDLRAQSAVQPEVRMDGAHGPVLHAPDGSGQGLTRPRGTTAPDRLAHLADQVQEWAVEALWSEGAPAVWPHCPEHPNSHPLRATVADEAAVWACPKSGAVVARIGELESRPTGSGETASHR